MNFNEVEIQSGSQNKYVSPGVEVLTVTGVTSGKSAQKQSPFVTISFENKTGQTLSGDYYLNGGAFTPSAQTFFKYIAAAYKLDLTNETDKATVKNKLAGTTDEVSVASKLATCLVGKSLAMVVKGKWINPTDSTKQAWIKAEPSNLVAPADKANTLTYNESKHITGSPVTNEDPSVVTTEKDPWS